MRERERERELYGMKKRRIGSGIVSGVGISGADR